MYAISPFQIAGPRNISDLPCSLFADEQEDGTGKATADAEEALRMISRKNGTFPATSTRVIQDVLAPPNEATTLPAYQPSDPSDAEHRC